MQLSFYQASFCVVALCALICKAYGSEDRTGLQGEVRKRIFCNFYGCGSKRSSPSVEDINDVASNLVDVDAADIPLGGYADHSTNLGRDEISDVARESAILGAQRFLRAAALWEAMKEKLHKEHARKLFKRSSS